MSTAQALGRFAIVGGAGFVIEAVIMTALTQHAAWTPWQARVPSFLTAVTVTWLLNRRHTFAGRQMQRRSVEAILYAATQVCGALINLVMFGVCLKVSPALRATPVIPLAIGAAGGFAFNFLVSNLLIYSRARASSGS